LPSQFVASEPRSFAQLAARQSLDAGGNVHAVVSAPLQAPLQAVPSPAQVARGATGTPVAGEQVPFVGGKLHASH
jgi:hypothetical protein